MPFYIAAWIGGKKMPIIIATKIYCAGKLRQGSARRNRLPRIGNRDIHRHVETTFGEGVKLRQVDNRKKAAAISISFATIP